MTAQQKTTLHLVARWLVESVSSEQLDRLADHLSNEHDERAEELRRAMGYET